MSKKTSKSTQVKKPVKASKTSKVSKVSKVRQTTKPAKKVASKVTKVAKKTSKKAKSNTVKTAATQKKTSKKLNKKTPSRASSDTLIHGIEPYKIKAREKYMSPPQMKHFRDILIAWKTNLLDEVSRTIHLMQDENINHPDPNDRASQETDMSLELRNRDRERKLLKKIDATIARVDNDDYGWCDRCGIEIGIRRLEARPTAELCVDCKTLNEIKERQMI